MTQGSPLLPRSFGPLPAALAQRRQLTWIFKFLTASWGLFAAALAGGSLAWTLGIIAAIGALTLPVRWILKPLQERELKLQPNAVELRRGGFRRFVVFENLRHVHVVQGPGEVLLSLRLDTDDDSVLIRDMDGLPEVFAAVAGAKPDRTMIELESQRFDPAQPLFWGSVATALTAVLIYLMLF